MGPFRVIQQIKNDVTLRHLAIGHERIVHVSRVKPFFGSVDDALGHSQYQSLGWEYLPQEVFIV